MNARLDVNVALNRQAYQSSTFVDPPHGAYHAGRANDGDHSTSLWAMSCAASAHHGTNPWWAVDLGVALHVHGVRLTNRADEGWGTISVYSVQLHNSQIVNMTYENITLPIGLFQFGTAYQMMW